MKAWGRSEEELRDRHCGKTRSDPPSARPERPVSYPCTQQIRPSWQSECRSALVAHASSAAVAAENCRAILTLPQRRQAELQAELCPHPTSGPAGLGRARHRACNDVAVGTSVQHHPPPVYKSHLGTPSLDCFSISAAAPARRARHRPSPRPSHHPLLQ